MEYLVENLIQIILKRLQEGNEEIRCAAYEIGARLYNIQDADDPILMAYLDGMRLDLSPTVRKACVDHVGLNKVTLLDIINRTKDIDKHVRLAAYKRLATKVRSSGPTAPTGLNFARYGAVRPEIFFGAMYQPILRFLGESECSQN